MESQGSKDRLQMNRHPEAVEPVAAVPDEISAKFAPVNAQ
jgi:hypothetical protein